MKNSRTPWELANYDFSNVLFKVLPNGRLSTPGGIVKCFFTRVKAWTYVNVDN